MAQTMVLLVWTLLVLLNKINADNHNIDVGVNWGNIASHPLDPKIVVKMLKDNGIKKVKLFDSGSDTLSALSGSRIQVMVGIPNNMLKDMTNYKHAQSWVKENVTNYLHDGGADIRYVAVGNEPFLSSYHDAFKEDTFIAMENIQTAIEEAGHGKKIKVSTPLNADVYESSSNLPSKGDFRKDIKGQMLKIVKFLKQKNSPFIVNIYPFLSLHQNENFPEKFAFFDGGSSKTIQDNNHKYTNVFDANYDTLVWTLKKHGVGDLKIIVGEVGWPTDGHEKADSEYAKRFYDGLFKKLAANKGTPMQPGKMEVYLFGLLDEDKKSIAPGPFERHWGIFRYDGTPKFPMDFSGKGHDKVPIGAKGVQYQEKKWCVLNMDAPNQDKAQGALQYACANSDCTALDFSCRRLSPSERISYGFNMYFQMNDQSVEACNFDGLASIISRNASAKDCLFPLALESNAMSIRIGALGVVFWGYVSIFLLLS